MSFPPRRLDDRVEGAAARSVMWHGIALDLPSSFLFQAADGAGCVSQASFRVLDAAPFSLGLPDDVAPSPALHKSLDESRRLAFERREDGWRFRAWEGDTLVLQAVVERSCMRVEKHAQDAALRRWFHSWLLPLWLEWQGIPCLHANALVHRQGLVGIAGPSGSGKTTLSLALQDLGWQLQSDDLLALHADEQTTFCAYPGPARLHLAADSFGYFVEGRRQDLPPPTPGGAKRLVASPVAQAAPGRALPVVAMLYLDRQDSDGQDGETQGGHLTRLSTSEALVASLRNGVTEELPRSMGLEGQRLQRLAAFAARVPAYRYRYPTGFHRLPEVARRLEMALEEVLP